MLQTKRIHDTLSYVNLSLLQIIIITINNMAKTKEFREMMQPSVF